MRTHRPLRQKFVAQLATGLGVMLSPIAAGAQDFYDPSAPPSPTVIYPAAEGGLFSSPSSAACSTCQAHGRKSCGTCGLTQYPFSEKHYIKQFCKPTINPSACFGHFKPQITRWSQACPNWGGGDSVNYSPLPPAAPVSADPVTPAAPTATSDPGKPTPMPMPNSDTLPPLKEPGKANPLPAPAPMPTPAAPRPVPKPDTNSDNPVSIPATSLPEPMHIPNGPIVVPALPNQPIGVQAPSAIPSQPVSIPRGKF